MVRIQFICSLCDPAICPSMKYQRRKARHSVGSDLVNVGLVYKAAVPHMQDEWKQSTNTFLVGSASVETINAALSRRDNAPATSV